MHIHINAKINFLNNLIYLFIYLSIAKHYNSSCKVVLYVNDFGNIKQLLTKIYVFCFHSNANNYCLAKILQGILYTRRQYQRKEFKILDRMQQQALHVYKKRRRLNEIWEEQDIIIITTSGYETKISDLPTDTLHAIFNWIPPTFLATNVKLVSKFFQNEVSEYLYRKYMKNFSRLTKIYNKSARSYNIARNSLIKRQMFKILMKIEMVIHEYKVLEASIWRYLRLRKSQCIFCSCLGKILENFDCLYYRLYNKRGDCGRYTKNEKSLATLTKLIKSYLFHFERSWEVNLNKNCFISGAKICDILDSCVFTNRKVVKESFENGICNLKLHYSLPNAWFHVFPLSDQKLGPITWQEQQRLMYLRLRRLAKSHTSQQIQQHHLSQAEQLIGTERQQEVQVENSVYTGFGEFDKELFFYGNFNNGGYKVKVRKMENRDVTPEEESPNDLNIFVDLTCPIAQAPLILYKQYYLHVDNQPFQHVLQRRRSTRLIKNQFYMKMEFQSTAQYRSYFPQNFQYIVSEDERLKRDEKISRLMKK